MVRGTTKTYATKVDVRLTKVFRKIVQFKELTMSRCGSNLFLVVIVSFFGAVTTPAQTTLQGRSQYGGLLRNVNSQRCIDVFGSSTSKNANVQNYGGKVGGIHAGSSSSWATGSLPSETSIVVWSWT